MANSRGPGQPIPPMGSLNWRRSLSVFCSYAHKDERLRQDLDNHLSVLRRSSQIEIWHDRQILPGTNVDNEIDRHLVTSDIILLLVSPHFLASDYCCRHEMQCAIERHIAGLAVVIPIILRPCEWDRTPFGSLLALPRDGKPVTTWPVRDEALLNVAKGVRKAVEELAAIPEPSRLIRTSRRKA